MVFYAWRAWVYALPFVGLALGISQMMRHPYHAMGLGLVALAGMGVLSLMARHFAGEGWRQLWQIVDFVFPMGHRMNLWRLRGAYVLTGGVYLAALASVYMVAGHIVFQRRGS
jgi:hypothetical protein